MDGGVDDGDEHQQHYHSAVVASYIDTARSNSSRTRPSVSPWVTMNSSIGWRVTYVPAVPNSVAWPPLDRQRHMNQLPSENDADGTWEQMSVHWRHWPVHTSLLVVVAAVVPVPVLEATPLVQ